MIDMITFMSKAKVAGKVLPFMKGIVISSNFLLLLYDYLSSLYAFRYILTRRLNQDVLEHLFGIIRQIGGGHDSIWPLKFKYRIKNYILGNEKCIVV